MLTCSIVSASDQWHYGMKAHVGVDTGSRMVHAVICMAANINDVTQADWPHGEETAAFCDAGYRSVDKPEEAQGPQWHVAMQPGKGRALDLKRKTSIRAKVEYPLHVIKNLFRHCKVRYTGLAKKQVQLFSLLGLANLVIANRSLLHAHAQGASQK
jgi:IS5 family transposase